MLSVLPNSIPPGLPGSSLTKASFGAQSPVLPVSQRPSVAGADQFTGLSTQTAQGKPVQFGGAGKAVGFFAGGLASGIILWPLSIFVGLLGIAIHPLLPVAALMGVAPIGLSIWGAVSGAKSKQSPWIALS